LEELFRKCQQCDEASEKSINLVENRYIKTKNGFYHYDCYINHLINKNYSYKESQIETAFLWNELQKTDEQIKVKSQTYKNKLYNLLVDLYGFKGTSEIPNHFYIKINNIVAGNYEKINEEIPYMDLYYMYKKMITMLNKIAYQKSITNDKRLFWDLAIVISKYPEFRKWKLSKLEEDATIQSTIDWHKTFFKIKSKTNDDTEDINIYNDEDLLF